MKKIVKKIIQFILVAVILVGIYLYGGGTYVYHEVTKDLPLNVAVQKTIDDTSTYVEYEELNPYLVNAIIVTEDRRFFNRKGFDWIALSRALLNNIRYDKPKEGGSTITQQIAKNLYFQGQKRGLKEKVAEGLIMLDLENKYSKQELLALYANMNYYGDGYYGIYDASMNYYNVKPIDLSIAQCAILAGIPNAPSILQLSTGYELAFKRETKILNDMFDKKLITKDQLNSALLEDTRAISDR